MIKLPQPDLSWNMGPRGVSVFVRHFDIDVARVFIPFHFDFAARRFDVQDFFFRVATSCGDRQATSGDHRKQ